MGPERPPVRDAVVSSAAEGMAVHGPEQQWLALAVGLEETLCKGGEPRDRLPTQLPPRGLEMLPPETEVGLRGRDLRQGPASLRHERL